MILFKTDNSNTEICSVCKGACCKRAPGIFHPADFGLPDFKLFESRFLNENLAVDWWDGDPRKEINTNDDYFSRVLFVRPQTIHTDRLYDASWGGQCKNLTDTGCILKFKDRPYECRSLAPQVDMQCELGNNSLDKRALVIAWIPYQALIKLVANSKSAKLNQILLSGM